MTSPQLKRGVSSKKSDESGTEMNENKAINSQQKVLHEVHDIIESESKLDVNENSQEKRGKFNYRSGSKSTGKKDTEGDQVREFQGCGDNPVPQTSLNNITPETFNTDVIPQTLNTDLISQINNNSKNSSTQSALKSSHETLNTSLPTDSQNVSFGVHNNLMESKYVSQ